MPTTKINRTELVYDDTGHGAPVVLLHAGIADRRMWRAQIPALAARHRVVNLDLPGYGESGSPTEPYANHDHVTGLLDALDIAQAALVGCSSGGAVAIDTALAHPGRVSALALIDSAVSGHQWSAEADELWDALIGDVDETDLAAMARAEVRFWVVGPRRQAADVDPTLLELALKMDRRALAAEAALKSVGERPLDPPAIGRLGEITVPVLVMAGASDVPDVSRLADRIAEQIPTARRLPDVPHAAHLLPLERPEPVTEALLSFLSRMARTELSPGGAY